MIDDSVAEITKPVIDEDLTSRMKNKEGIRQPMKTKLDQMERLTAIFSALPEAKQDEVMALVEAIANHSKMEDKKPDISKIPLWGGKKKDGSAIEWLDKHYGHFIKNPEDGLCYIFRQDLLNKDPKLVKGVDGEAYQMGKKAGTFLPTRSDELNIIEQGMSREMIRIVTAVQRREYRTAPALFT